MNIQDKEGIRIYLDKNKSVDFITKCWLYGNENDYVRIRLEEKLYYIHRLSLYVYTNNFNIFDEEIKCLHVTWCKNKNCFNPEHLYSGDQRDNVIDKGFLISISSTYPCGHPRTPENSTTNKACRECHRSYGRVGFSRYPNRKRKSI